MNIAQFITHPQLRNPQHKDYRLASILAGLLVAFLVFIIPYNLYYWIYFPQDIIKVWNNLLGVVILVGSMILFRYSSNIKTTLLVLSIFSYPPVMISVYNTGGIYSSDIIWIVLLILTQTLFVGYRWALISGVIALFYILFLSYIEHGLMDKDNFFKSFILIHDSTHTTINLVFVILLLVGLLSIFARNLEVTSKKFEQLSMQKIADLEKALIAKTEEFSKIRGELAKEFYDEMGNNLASINILTQSISNKLQETHLDDEDLIKQLDNIEKRSLELYEGTKDFIWGVDLKSDYVKEVYLYVKNFSIPFLETLGIQFYSELHHQSSTHGRLNPTVGRQLVFICKELIVNAARHSQCKEIFFHVAEQNNQLFVVVSDNGKGYSIDEVNKKGLNTIESKLKKLDARQKVSSTSQGTSVTLIFDLQLSPFSVTEEA